MYLNYTAGMAGSTATVPAIPSKYAKWPDTKLQANPPGPPKPPLLSPAHSYVPKKNGMASLA